MSANEQERLHLAEAAVRGIASAFKTLRLYPPASPIPREAAEGASDAIELLLAGRESAVLRVERDGLSVDGEAIPDLTPGAGQIAEVMRDLGVAEVVFAPHCRPEDILELARALSLDPADARARGGVGEVIAQEGVTSIRVADISILLTSAEMAEGSAGPMASPQTAAQADADAAGLLRSVAHDPARLAAWVSGVAADREALDGGLAELSVTAGGAEALGATLAGGFQAMAPSDRDQLLALAAEPGKSSEATRAFVSMLPDDALADALAGGRFGSNMLMLSSSLTKLPLGDRLGRVMEQLKDRLPTLGHGEKELRFLDHMVEVRLSDSPDTPITTAEPGLGEIAREVAAAPRVFSATHAEVAIARATGSERALSTMLTLLDQQRDLNLYGETLDRVAAMVPGLVQSGDLTLAASVLDQLAGRSAAAQGAWPGLRERLDHATATALGRTTLRSLLTRVVEGGDATLVPARDLMRWGGERAVRDLTDIALASGDPDTFAAAEQLVGRRMLDELCRTAATVKPGGVAAVARRLAAAASEPRCATALELLAARPDAASRRELAAAISRVDATAAVLLTEKLLGDRDAEVAIVAARGLGHNGSDGASRVLASRLGHLDVDGRDFPLAREIVLSLARHHDPIAKAALGRVASRRSLMKRGNYTAMQEIVRQAQQMQRGTSQ